MFSSILFDRLSFKIELLSQKLFSKKIVFCYKISVKFILKLKYIVPLIFTTYANMRNNSINMNKIKLALTIR